MQNGIRDHELGLKRADITGGHIETCKCGNVAQSTSGVVSPKGLHTDLGFIQTQAESNTLGEEAEYLPLRDLVGQYERVVERGQEPDLY